jgi:uncharacterized CHY-type Zn-finger protein
MKGLFICLPAHLMECFICAKEKKVRVVCGICKKDLCAGCFQRLLKKKCPFCRAFFEIQDDEWLRNLKEDFRQFKIKVMIIMVFFSNFK